MGCLNQYYPRQEPQSALIKKTINAELKERNGGDATIYISKEKVALLSKHWNVISGNSSKLIVSKKQ